MLRREKGNGRYSNIQISRNTVLKNWCWNTYSNQSTVFYYFQVSSFTVHYLRRTVLNTGICEERYLNTGICEERYLNNGICEERYGIREERYLNTKERYLNTKERYLNTGIREERGTVVDHTVSARRRNRFL